MAELTTTEYRDRGLGDDARRHSGRKRTRGEEGDDGVGLGRVMRGYDDYDYEHEEMKRRSLLPRDEVHRDVRRKSYRDSRDDYVSQSNGSYKEKRRQLRRSRSPDSRPERSPATRNHHHRHHRRHHRSPTRSTRTPDELPLGARLLVRSDLDTFRPLLAQYLKVQKGKDIVGMDEREVRGRWKSFVGKWNRGELAEGWYHPETLEEAIIAGYGARDASQEGINNGSVISGDEDEDEEKEDHKNKQGRVEEERDDDDDYGPTLPESMRSRSRDPSEPTLIQTKHGPGIPSLQDLDQRRGDAEEERLEHIESLRLARRADRAEQRSRLDELAPRADAGTRERRLEKKREVNDKMRSFRNRSPGATAEVGEAELMGGGEDGVAEYKRAKAAAERRRTDREVRREEEARAKAAEREERVREYIRREEGTMEGLRRIARERFG
ncbi:uncharacterized protein F4822DRAFT_407352 [Hypoxylon trugodes]|uniref:uncharacterized protein n=1 Tax=Hypoxylon trugodes TaxID=326681 RepID=UPI002197E825|nr:uncharacterized protein F4822DRAFT_407352 [Hypoxylon trugodes]KAI1387710.1 hypothetical protein F4822DRAFT_407352 [Hypoxylon trugodes]